MSRMYSDIWEKLKKNKRCAISVKHPQLFARIRKGVINEKYEDKQFRIANSHDYFYLEVTFDEKKKIITFELKQRWGIEGIKTLEDVL